MDTGNHYQLSFGSIQWVTNMRIAGGVTAGIHNRGIFLFPFADDKDDKNDKDLKVTHESDCRGLWKHVILVMEKLRVEKSPKMQTHYSNSGRNETLSRVKTIVKIFR